MDSTISKLFRVNVSMNASDNYSGSTTRYCYFMNHDYNSLSSTWNNTWGTSSNPYAIGTYFELLRLKDIVNGDSAWDSTGGSTYSGKYFLVSANISSPAFGFVVGTDSSYGSLTFY